MSLYSVETVFCIEDFFFEILRPLTRSASLCRFAQGQSSWPMKVCICTHADIRTINGFSRPLKTAGVYASLRVNHHGLGQNSLCSDICKVTVLGH